MELILPMIGGYVIGLLALLVGVVNTVLIVKLMFKVNEFLGSTQEMPVSSEGLKSMFDNLGQGLDPFGSEQDTPTPNPEDLV